MKLYHGTNYSSAMNICMNGIDLSKSQKFLDFGVGFYTTPSFEHAAKIAVQRTDKYNLKNKTEEEPYIVEMKVDFRKRKDLFSLQLPRHCEEWGKFVLYNRLHKEILKEYNISEHNQDSRYDVCVGEIADGTIANESYLVNNHEKGLQDVNYEKFLKKFGSDYPQQYSFHTEKSISCIYDLKCDILSNKEKYQKMKGR